MSDKPSLGGEIAWWIYLAIMIAMMMMAIRQRIEEYHTYSDKIKARIRALEQHAKP